MPRGGKRAGAGRKSGTGRFGEPTVGMRIPHSLIGTVSALLGDHIREAGRSNPSTSSTLKIDVPATGEIRVIGPIEARRALEAMHANGIRASVVMLDPWYRAKGSPGRAAYIAEMIPLLSAAARVGEHVFVWGFPETLGRLVDHWPDTLKLEAWLTWHFNNIPSRGKGWRPAQQSCLHLRRPGSKLYPQHFYSPRHREMAAENRLEFKMGPLSVFSDALLSGFIKRTEQTGHRAQKPVSVMERLLKMTTRPGDLVVDPTAGSGTTGIAARRLGCAAILSDRSPASLRTIKTRIEKEILQRPDVPPRS